MEIFVTDVQKLSLDRFRTASTLVESDILVVLRAVDLAVMLLKLHVSVQSVVAGGTDKARCVPLFAEGFELIAFYRLLALGALVAKLVEVTLVAVRILLDSLVFTVIELGRALLAHKTLSVPLLLKSSHVFADERLRATTAFGMELVEVISLAVEVTVFLQVRFTSEGFLTLTSADKVLGVEEYVVHVDVLGSSGDIFLASMADFLLLRSGSGGGIIRL